MSPVDAGPYASYTPGNRLFRKTTGAVIHVKLIRLQAVIGNVNVGVAVAIEVGRSDPTSRQRRARLGPGVGERRPPIVSQDDVSVVRVRIDVIFETAEVEIQIAIVVVVRPTGGPAIEQRQRGQRHLRKAAGPVVLIQHRACRPGSSERQKVWE